MAEAAEFRTRRVWSGPEVETEGTISPDGRFLTYIKDGDLWIDAWEGGALRMLAGSDNKDIAVQSYLWSPDSQAIALIEVDERAVPIRGLPDYLETETALVPVRRPFPGERSRAEFAAGA